MMGQRKQNQGQLFYEFCLDEVVPDDHLVRKIRGLLDLSWVYAELALAPGENPEEFAVHYTARRAHHLVDDPIIDDLVQKITLIHRRFNRAFRSEAMMLESRSLDELFVDYRAPIKNLPGYEAANRKLLQTLTSELVAYEKAEAQRGLKESQRAAAG
jgi:hypothetical protein